MLKGGTLNFIFRQRVHSPEDASWRSHCHQRITCLKNLGTLRISGFVATLRFRGAVTRPATLSKFFSGTLSVAGALVQNVRA